jgi:hypothetical protein
MRRTMPRRIQRKRSKGWKMPPNTIYVGRPTKWGNPFVIGKHGTRKDCLVQFDLMLAGFVNISKDNVRQQIEYRKWAARNIRHLRGKDLACFCPLDQPCHADTLLHAANGLSRAKQGD